ncbi:hypothetical protein C0Q70_03282 [Pomacea canaliculata]|uniref:C2H2-type domain-containing protein n=1 Tax=Pomacea canaliculata TaxID=400727 RepID=A0A2T7PS95_POMCA|nr:hypothetical protein C0Q70_03282 [Pomacea canaliculata]
MEHPDTISTAAEDDVKASKVLAETATKMDASSHLPEDYDELIDLHAHFGDSSTPSSTQVIDGTEFIRLDRPHAYRPSMQHISIDINSYKRWRRIATAQGLFTDAQIANFLTQHYENTANGVSFAARCINCNTPLSLTCIKCSLLQQTDFTQTSPITARESYSLVMETTESPASKVEGMGMDPEDKNKAVEAKTVCRPPEDYEGLLDLQVHFNSAARPVAPETMTGNINVGGHQQCRPTVQHLALDGEIFERWRHFGNAHGMTSDTDIATFLMQQYENTIQSINRCAGCHILMPLYCAKCSMVAQETNPAAVGYGLQSNTGVTPVPLGPFVTGDSPAAFQMPALLDSQTSLSQHDGKHITYMTDDNRLKVPKKKKKKLKKIRGKKGEYTCRECGTHIVQTRAKKGTRRTGYKPYKCNDCGAAYTYRRGMEEHLFKKDELTTFSQPGSLKTHTRKHTGEKPYKCETCGAAFSDHSTLWKHKRNNSCAAGSNQARGRKVAAPQTPSTPPPPPPPPLPPPPTPPVQMTMPMGSVNQQQTYRPTQIEEPPYVGSVTWCFPMQHH